MPHWFSEVFAQTVGILGLLITLWQQANNAASRAQVAGGEGDSGGEGEGGAWGGNAIHEAFRTLYLNRRGDVSVVQSVLVSVFWVLLFFLFMLTTRGINFDVEPEVQRNITLVMLLNLFVDYLSVLITYGVIRHLGARVHGIVLFLLDFAATYAVAVLALYGLFSIVGFVDGHVRADPIEALWLPYQVLQDTMYNTWRQPELGLVLYGGAVISTFSSTFWLGALLLYAGFTGRHAAASAGRARRVRLGAFWVQAAVLLVAYGVVVMQVVAEPSR